MRIREWQDILADVTDRNVHPNEWRAVAGDRQSGVGEDLYLGHPQAGLFVLKTYAKNPYDLRGVGSHVARNLDDEIGSFLPDHDESGRFAVQQAPDDEERAESQATKLSEVLKAHADAPTTPDALFEDVMDAIESPAFGPMAYDQYDRPDELEALADQFEEAETLLNAELEELIERDEVDRGFM